MAIDKKRYNMRISGLGGQGVVTSAHILGSAMDNAGKYASLVPFFGSEKRMAPGIYTSTFSVMANAAKVMSNVSC